MNLSLAIRVLSLVIGSVIFDATAVFSYGIDQILSDQPYVFLFGLANIAWWLFGLFSFILLLFINQYARWALIVFFLLSFVSAMTAWIPGAWYLSEAFESPFVKMIILQLTNLMYIILIFWLYSLHKKASNIIAQSPANGDI